MIFFFTAAFDWELLENHIDTLKKNKPIQIPHYNFVTHQRDSTTTSLMGPDIIILEGILIFHKMDIVDKMDLKLFVDTDDDIRLIRRSKI